MIHSLLVLIITLFLTSVSFAEVVLDGTVGPRGALRGPDYAVTHDLGQQAGGNLFHSFSRFNLNFGERATFSGPNTIENIISRVTGGSASNIDGILRSSIQGANLYFMNPSGIMFGPHAQLDITGSFHATTADYLKLGESGRFDATFPADSVLTTAAPSAFGFLSDNPASISLEGSGSFGANFYFGFKGLTVPEGETLSLIGGDVSISSGLLYGLYPVESRLIAPVGRINIASVASSGEVVPTESGLDAESFEKLGRIEILKGSLVSVNGLGAGSIYIRGGQFVIDSSDIGVNTSTMSGLYAIGSDMMDLSIVSVEVDTLTLTGGAQINTTVFGAGKGGKLTVNAKESVSISGFDSNGNVSRLISGGSGEVSVTTSSLLMDDSGLIQAVSEGNRNAGNVYIEADRVTLKGGAWITTSSKGAGKGGKLTVNAKESVSISGFDSNDNISGLFSNANSSGSGGEVSITTPSLVMDNKGTIVAATFGEGNAGNVSVEADTVTLKGGAQIRTDTVGAGKGGKLTVNAKESISISGFDSNGYGSGLMSNAYGSGSGGDVSIEAPSLVMDNEGLIQAETQSEGDAGNVSIEADRLTLKGGAWITTDSKGAGKGGRLKISASESLSISGVSSRGYISELSSNARDSGSGGEVSITAPSLVMDNDGIIQAATYGEGDAGNVSVEADRVTLKGGARISTDTWGAGKGGNLTVNASKSISISGFDSDDFGSGLFSNTYKGGGEGGVISLSTPSLVMDKGGRIQAKTKGEGNAGKVSIEVEKLSLTGGARISTDSEGAGRGGNLTVNASEKVSISGSDSNYRIGGLFSNAYSSGMGGEISITTPSLVMVDEGFIQAATHGEGKAGNISIEADRVTLKGGIWISTDSWGAGKGGNLTINASEKVSILGGATFGSFEYESGIFGTAYSSGSGGEVSITTPSLIMDNKGVIEVSTKGEGNAGNVSIEADKLSLTGGAQIDTSSSGAGKGGNLTVSASESISISGFDSKGIESGLFSSTTSSGDGGIISVSAPSLFMDDKGTIQAKTSETGTAGHITVDAENIRLTNNASINTESTGTGKAGNIFINADDTVKLQNSSITAATDNADGGNIQLQAKYMLDLIDSDITATVKGGTGDGGNIDIDPVYVVLENSKIIANAEKGRGGNISITANHFIASPDSEVSASSRLGVSGNVVIDSPAEDISGNLTALSSTFLQTEALSPEYCATREGELSSFIIKGRNGLPPRPDSLLMSP